MALDGIVMANLTRELQSELVDGRINKIAQPEKDELLLTIKTRNGQARLLISASASLPLMYLTEENKQSPMVAPNFCMLLRKHLNSARIKSISQPSLERIIQIEIEHLNELGDLCTKYLIIEIMGKHSNIIFCDTDFMIIDSIKHISGIVSSVREVLPGRQYFVVETVEKLNPYEVTYDEFVTKVLQKPTTLEKAIYTSLTGFSPVMANELSYRANIDADTNCAALTDANYQRIYNEFDKMMLAVKQGDFVPNIIFDDNIPIEFASLSLSCYETKESQTYDRISTVLLEYYAAKSVVTRIKQKSSDLRHIVATAIERARKKKDLQEKQLKDTDKRDKFRIYGEMINSYGYSLSPGDKELVCENYYTNEEIKVPLDQTLTPAENAKKYFDKYNKLKRTYEATKEQLLETASDLTHLESIANSLDIALNEEDLVQVKEELVEYGYMKRKAPVGKGNKKQKITSKPFHYISSDGYHMYVGKNNYQNEELTFKLATGNDWWFHAKGLAGSHVIVKSDNDDLPDKTFEEAAKLAAYYSKANKASKVEVDYIQKKHVKKPNGSKPGFVIYHTNYSMLIEPDITDITQVKG